MTRQTYKTLKNMNISLKNITNTLLNLKIKSHPIEKGYNQKIVLIVFWLSFINN